MKTIEGWLCPDLLSGPGSYLGRCPHTDLATARVKETGVAVQAGGHIGTVPVYLSRRFARVYTWEPEPENFAALVANSFQHARGRIYASQGVLGDRRGPVAMAWSTKSTGQHKVGPKAAAPTVPTFRVDDLALDRLDAIFLDVEGYEIHALAGALESIARFHPVIMCEENKRCKDQGFRIGDLARFLAKRGYEPAATVADDIVFTHKG